MALLRTPTPEEEPPRTNAGASTNPAEQHNIIGKGTVLEGTIRSSGNVHVSGTVTGRLEVDGRTVVMPGGVVEGEIVGASAEIGGRVKGEVRVRDRLVLKSTAVVEGDLNTQKLVIEEGATLTGRCDMGAMRGGDGMRGGERPTRRLGADEPSSASGPSGSGSGSSSGSGAGHSAGSGSSSTSTATATTAPSAGEG
jgi:cytoskeletal protein CcmA (bactofilin family)